MEVLSEELTELAALRHLNTMKHSVQRNDADQVESARETAEAQRETAEGQRRTAEKQRSMLNRHFICTPNVRLVRAYHFFARLLRAYCAPAAFIARLLRA